MTGYVVKRLLMIVPTLVLVLALSFLLQSLAPGDKVAKHLDLEGSHATLTKEAYLQSYRSISARYGLDLPTFYFSIQPSYYPDTLYRVIPQEKRNLLTQMLRQVKDWEQVANFDKHLTTAIGELKDEGESRRVRNELLKLEQDRSLSDVTARCHKIENLDVDLTDMTSVNILIRTVRAMQTSKSFSYPTFRYHGSNNQFQLWITSIFDKDRNVSLLDGTPVIDKILRALKWTTFMSIVAFILVSIISLVIGYSQVYLSGGLYDRGMSILLYILIAIPTFWLASLLVVFFTTPEYGAWTDIFPSIGLKPSFVERSFAESLMDNLGQLILPTICMTVLSISYLSIQLKSDLLEALKQPHVLMARAKGLSDKRVLRSHALPNALVPYTTILTGAIPGIFAGAVIIEDIFNIPGIGRLILTSVRESDWPVVFTVVIVISIATMIGYLLGDIILMKLYPKTVDDLTTSAKGVG